MAWADTFTATPTEFIVTINKVEFYNSTTGVWEVAGQGDYTFDITSVQPGQLCGGYGSPEGFSPGTYTQMRVTVSRTMQITASASHGGTIYYTLTGTDAVVNAAIGNGAQVADADATGPAVRGTNILPTDVITLAADTDYFIVTENLSSPAELGPGTQKRARIDFDATDVITFNHAQGACYISAQPNITVGFY